MKKCPYCNEEFSPQGLVGHVQFKHADELKKERAEHASEHAEDVNKLNAEQAKHASERAKHDSEDAEHADKFNAEQVKHADELTSKNEKYAELKNELKSDRDKHASEREKDADESRTGKIIGILGGILIGIFFGKRSSGK